MYNLLFIQHYYIVYVNNIFYIIKSKINITSYKET